MLNVSTAKQPKSGAIARLANVLKATGNVTLITLEKMVKEPVYPQPPSSQLISTTSQPLNTVKTSSTLVKDIERSLVTPAMEVSTTSL